MPLRIDAGTEIAGVTGWPLDHTLSPAMHNAAYEAMDVNRVYLPMPVREGTDLLGVLGALKRLPVIGLNVTMPYKRVVMNMCDEVAKAAQLAGAVNTLHFVDGRIIGYNTDGRGLTESLEVEAGFAPEGKRVVILGTGGAAGGALVAFVLARAAHITLAGRRPAVGENMVDGIDAILRDTEVEVVALGDAMRSSVETADLVVNATPLGMNDDDPLPLDTQWLRSGQVVADMVYRKAATPLVEQASAKGVTAIGGLGMLVAQAAIAIEIWNGDRQTVAPRDVMRAAAEAAMSQPRTGGDD